MTQPNPRILAQRYVQDIAAYMRSEGIDVAPQLAHDDNHDFKVNNLVGIDRMVLRTNRAFRIKLSESLDDAERQAKATGKDLAAVVQFRIDEPASRQYVVMTAASFVQLLKAI